MSQQQPRYRELVNELIAKHWPKVSKPGSLHEARIAHDDWCPIFNGGSCACNCEVILINHTAAHPASCVGAIK
jgi:hypothetical protein